MHALLLIFCFCLKKNQSKRKRIGEETEYKYLKWNGQVLALLCFFPRSILAAKQLK